MRKGVSLITATTSALLLASGVALAVTRDCPSKGGYCKGTNTSDKTFHARDNERDIVSCGGEDKVYFDKSLDQVNPANCEKRVGG